MEKYSSNYVKAWIAFYHFYKTLAPTKKMGTYWFSVFSGEKMIIMEGIFLHLLRSKEFHIQRGTGVWFLLFSAQECQRKGTPFFFFFLENFLINTNPWTNLKMMALLLLWHNMLTTSRERCQNSESPFMRIMVLFTYPAVLKPCPWW